MTNNRHMQRAAEVLGPFANPNTPELNQRVAAALVAAREEGYRAAVEESRKFCARSGGCIG